MRKKMSFKELLQQDVKNVFLNPAEFGEEHVIGGKKMVAVVDDNELLDRKERMDGNMDGVYTEQTLLYVSAQDFGPCPPIGRILEMDGREYVVTDVLDEGGMYSIRLEDAQS